MKDQITALMEALRLSQAEIEKLRRKRQDLATTLDHVEEILSDPVVMAAIYNLKPSTGSPSVVPEQLDQTASRCDGYPNCHQLSQLRPLKLACRRETPAFRIGAKCFTRNADEATGL